MASTVQRSLTADSGRQAGGKEDGPCRELHYVIWRWVREGDHTATGIRVRSAGV